MVEGGVGGEKVEQRQKSSRTKVKACSVVVIIRLGVEKEILKSELGLILIINDDVRIEPAS